MSAAPFKRDGRVLKNKLQNITAPGKGDRRTILLFAKLGDKPTAVRSGQSVEFGRHLSVVFSQDHDRCTHKHTNGRGIGR